MYFFTYDFLGWADTLPLTTRSWWQSCTSFNGLLRSLTFSAHKLFLSLADRLRTFPVILQAHVKEALHSPCDLIHSYWCEGTYLYQRCSLLGDLWWNLGTGWHNNQGDFYAHSWAESLLSTFWSTSWGKNCTPRSRRGEVLIYISGTGIPANQNHS